MHPLHWVYNNREFLQAISGIAIGLLTVLLIILNGIYVRANWTTMRLMQADVRFRTQPIPAMRMTIGTAGMSNTLIAMLYLSTSNAPLRLAFIRLEYVFKSDARESRSFSAFDNRFLPPGQDLEIQDRYEATEPLKDYFAVLTYFDLAGLSKFTSTFGADKTVTTTIIPSPSLPARIWAYRPWAGI